MLKTIDASEFKIEVGQILSRLEQGDEFIITLNITPLHALRAGHTELTYSLSFAKKRQTVVHALNSVFLSLLLVG